MRRHTLWVPLVTLLSIDPSWAAAQDRTQQSVPLLRDTTTPQPIDMLISATVRRVLGSRVFTLEDRTAPDGELIVIAPRAEATPLTGATILAGGRLRRLTEAELAQARGWADVDDRTREMFAERLVLVATSLRTATGRQLIADTVPVAKASQSRRPAPREVLRDPLDIKMHPAALGELIDVLGGRHVTLPSARVIAVINPRAFLIESPSALTPIVGNLDRLLVLVDGGALRVAAEAMVGSDLRVLGVARTALGMQVTREVPWPTELSREVVQRLEIRAAVLASSVQTSDGVELIDRQSPAPAATR